MITRFLFESFVGITALTCILLFGSVGISSLALFALLPLISRSRKTRPDEREYQLFYQTGNLTMGLMVLGLVLIHFLSKVSINGHLIGNFWMPLSIAFMLLAHGAAGTFIFRTR
ncbi:MAG: hypothetical protein WAN36_16735 [Calditrichia bacterium]